MGHEWEYHQDMRDEAAGCGAVIMIALIILVVFGCAVLHVAVQDMEACIAEEAELSLMDGSTAGANAVILEDLATDKWLADEWSVTLQDLANEPEPGGTYPPNVKNTPLVSDSTYGKGAGMVDIVTYDTTTNVEIRHYGQLMPDGTVRWYAAETVLDGDGKPVAMPRE